MPRSRRFRFSVFVAIAVVLATVGLPVPPPAGAAEASVSFDFDGAELVFQASSGSPVEIEFPSGGSLDGTWDIASGAFEGTLTVTAEVPLGAPLMDGTKLTVEPIYPGATVPVSGTIPADGSEGLVEVDLTLAFTSMLTYHGTIYDIPDLELTTSLDPTTGDLDLEATGFKGAPIDGCAGSGCAYWVQDLGTDWGLPVAVMIPAAEPFIWTNPGNTDTSFDLHFSGEALGPFTDVPAGHPFSAPIKWMSESGISTGYPGGTFRPTQAVARQAMASFLYKLAEEPTVTATEPFFADVGPSHAFYTPIQWMAETGLSLGTAVPGGKPLFKPSDAVSRQALAAFLFRYSEDDPATLTEPFFADVGASHQFYGPIQWMAESGISTGTAVPGGKPIYKPTIDVSRQAIAAFLYRYEHPVP